MKTTIRTLAAAALLCIPPAWAGSTGDPAQEILALERRALDGWMQGNPDPQLAITDPEITYIHAVPESAIAGLAALRKLYEQYRGKPLFDSYEIVNPKVQTAGDVAVLTYRLARRNGSATTYWDATHVYCRKKDGWRVIHTHWSEPKGAQQ